MNVSLRWHGGLLAIFMGITWLTGSGAQVATAQTLRNNPLRPAQPRVMEESSSVQQASATEPVRAPVRGDTLDRTRPAPRRSFSQGVYRTASYGSRSTPRTAAGFVPRHALVSQTEFPMEAIAEPIPMAEPGDMMLGDLPAEGEIMDSGCCGDVQADCGGCGNCGDCGGCGGCGHCNGCLIPCPRLSFDNFEFFAGVQGFTGPLNRGETGSFGFHYGANWAVPVPCLLNQPIGLQLGYRGISSNYSGASFSEDSRNQSFVTAGLFRRVDWGLQGGVVVDMLSDDWYYDTLELTQIRGELSWVYPQCHELGFWFSTGTKTSEVESAVMVNGQRQSIIETYEATDLMAFFYRRRFEAIGGGYGRVFAGFTGSSEGLIGADFKLPLTASLALQSEFTYLIPKDGNNRIAHLEEAWNVGITLVWYPGCRKATGVDYFRPLFDVADNGDMIVRPIQN